MRTATSERNQPTPSIDYLSIDSIAEGVGNSQVFAYVVGLARLGVQIRLVSFEKTVPNTTLREQLSALGIEWRILPFGRPGPLGGLWRTIRGARAVRSAAAVHARSDLAAAAAMLANVPWWLWDVRSLWADQLIALSRLREESTAHRVLRWVEKRASQRADAIVTLTERAIEVLAERHGDHVRHKAVVIPTCVDTDRFVQQPVPDAPRVRLLLSGTVNAYYDVPTMVRLVRAMRRSAPTELIVASPGPTAWEPELSELDVTRIRAQPSEMPAVVAGCHVGLSVCHLDAGPSLAAAVPTKIGEFLSTGRPVVVNEGLGDLDTLLPKHRAGVIIRDRSPAAVQHAAGAIQSLLDDPETPRRCRELAEKHFSLEQAVNRLAKMYPTSAKHDTDPQGGAAA